MPFKTGAAGLIPLSPSCREGSGGDAFLLSKDTVQLEQAAANPIATEAGKTIFEVLTGCQ